MCVCQGMCVSRCMCVKVYVCQGVCGGQGVSRKTDVVESAMSRAKQGRSVDKKGYSFIADWRTNWGTETEGVI